MIFFYRNEQGRLRLFDEEPQNMDEVIWVDMLNPSTAEESAIEGLLSIDVPTREEMEEIEISSRLYYEESSVFMTATLPSQTETDEVLLGPVTFVLAGGRLITVRYHEPRIFKNVPAHASRVAMGYRDGESVLISLLEAQIDRLADVLERGGRDVAVISKQVFMHSGAKPRKSTDFQTILEDIGRKGDMTSNILECLLSLERMFSFLTHAFQQGKKDKNIGARIKTLSRDCRSLIEHSGSLTQKITFLLDATLGLINIEQNAIIKIFSIAAVVFLPPTLVASSYGMNFHFMPELEWTYGYPFAVTLMVISAFLPFWYFKRRGWL